MTLYTLAVRSIRHELRRYAAFFLSAAFSVWMFFMYVSLLSHPQMGEEQIGSEIYGPLQAVTGVITVFATLFVLYAQTSFMKLRQKELGIYSLLGMRNGQMLRMIVYENLSVGVGATTAGVAFGAVCLKLFFLGVGHLLRLETPLTFAFSWMATLITYGLFLAVFSVISLAAYIRLRRAQVAELTRAAAKPKSPPRLTWWKVLLSVAGIVGAYWLLLTATGATIEQRFPPYLGLLLVGTALFFSQGSVALLRALRRRPWIYLRRTNLFIISQLVYKLQDNARVLFMVSILATIVLVAGGNLYGAHATAADWAAKQAPVHLVLTGDPGPVTSGRVAEALRKHGAPPVAEGHVPVVGDLVLLWGENNLSRSYGLTVTSASAFNRWAAAMALAEPLTLGPGEGILLEARTNSPPETARIGLAPYVKNPAAAGLPAPEIAAEVELLPTPAGIEPTRWLGSSRYSYQVLIVDDAAFASVQERFGAKQGVTIHGYKVENWRELGPAVRELSAALLADPRYERTMKESPWVRPLEGTWSWYDNQRQGSAIYLFLFGFISLLFFLAAGNMLYFKLLNDLQEDRRQYEALHKLGIRTEDVRRILGVQTLVLFFTPFVVAVAHAAVALHVFGSLLEVPTSLWGAMGTVTGVYLALHGAYFLVARGAYTQAVLGRP